MDSSKKAVILERIQNAINNSLAKLVALLWRFERKAIRKHFRGASSTSRSERGETSCRAFEEEIDRVIYI